MFRWLRWIAYTFLVFLLLFAGGGLFGYFYNGSKVRGWLAKPQPPGHMVSIANYRLYARVAGHASPTVVIFPAMASPSFEWWQIQERLSSMMRVVTYDRGGYGWSQAGQAPRTSQRIVFEARQLLETLKITPPYIVVGHSLGAFYAQHFARLYPQQVQGVVLLDPVIDDNQWKSKLNPILYQRFIDKTLFIKRGRTLAMFGLFRLLMTLPKDVPASQRQSIVEVYSNPDSYKIFLDEYLSIFRISFPKLHQFPAFPKIPLAVLYHDGNLTMKRMMKFNTTREQAMQVEQVWLSLTREYLKLSPLHRWLVAENSSHSIHLDRPDLVIQAVRDIAMPVANPATKRETNVPTKTTSTTKPTTQAGQK